MMETALITGASSGIGAELAGLFAADKTNVVLVARSEEKLRSLADQLRVKHDIQATVIVSDLAKPDAAKQICEKLSEQRLEVDVLVNNAGFGALGTVADLSTQRQVDMIQVNVTAMTQLTRLLLPAMLERKRGGVLNVGSIAAHQAGPNMAVYYATKAYVLSFSEALREEVIEHGLSVTCLEPGPTKTGFGEDSGMGSLQMFSSSTMSAEAVAKAGYRGFRNNDDVVIPGWKNRLMVSSTSFVPRFLTRKVVKMLQQP